VIAYGGATLGGNGALAGSVYITSGATLTGLGTISGGLTVDSGGLATLSGSTLIAGGSVTNNGIMRLFRGASLLVASGSLFTNHGTLDVITGSFSAPSGFANDGVVLDSTVVRAKSISRFYDGTLVSIDAYPAHTYRLQRSSTPQAADFTDLAGVPDQTNPPANTAPVEIAFRDTNPAPGVGFYRLRVDP
jgi:hypothetical protein